MKILNKRVLENEFLGILHLLIKRIKVKKTDIIINRGYATDLHIVICPKGIGERWYFSNQNRPRLSRSMIFGNISSAYDILKQNQEKLNKYLRRHERAILSRWLKGAEKFMEENKKETEKATKIRNIYDQKRYKILQSTKLKLVKWLGAEQL